MDNMYDVLKYVNENKEDSVLATIVKVEGSSYRKEGASMLFTETDKHIGLISIGCLEEDLAMQAKQLLEESNHFSKLVVYDTSAEDDLGWGRGSGCNGKIYILLEKITAQLQERLTSVYMDLQNGLDVLIIKNLRTIPKIIESTYEIAQVNQSLNNSHSITKRRLNRLVNEKFYHYILAKPRFIIFGAGIDVEPLVNLANITEFSVYIWDWRKELLCRTRFPNVTFIHDIKQFTFLKSDYVIIMTHDFQQDKRILCRLLKEKLTYLGVLGPRKRTKRLLDGNEIPPYIYSPVGLPIGADGPNEIAVSIIADLIRIKRGGYTFEEQIKRDWHLFSSGEK